MTLSHYNAMPPLGGSETPAPTHGKQDRDGGVILPDVPVAHEQWGSVEIAQHINEQARLARLTAHMDGE